MQEEAAGVPAGEAARALGITVPAVRKRIRRGTLRAYKVEGEWRVIVHPPGQTDGGPGRPGDVTIGEAVAQAARLQHLEDEVAFLRGLVAELTRRVPELPAPFPRREGGDPSPGPSPNAGRGAPTPLQRRGWLSRLVRSRRP